MSTDLRITIEKKTDQLNFEDFLGGITRTVTITGVKKGTREQQYDISIEGDDRVWRPAVTVLKLLVEAWGDDAKKWVGRQAVLYGDPTIMFGRDRVGGIRVSHLSDLPNNEPLSVMLTETRGKRKKHTVDPMPIRADVPATPAEPTAEEVAACTDKAELKAMWKRSGPERRAQIEQRVADLDNEPDGADG